MKRTIAWRASLALNLVLLVLLLWTGGSGVRVPGDAPSAVFQASGAAAEPQDPVSDPSADGDAPPFHWSQLNASDWSAYRDGLLEIGCPPVHVREILEPLVHRHFGERVRELAAPYERRFWELVLSGGQQAFEELKKSVEALETEQDRTLENLFAAFPSSDKPLPVLRTSTAETLDFLAPSVRDHVVELEAAHREEWRIAVSSSLDSDEGRKARLDELLERHRLEIAALFTPEEEDQWKLRKSRFAHLRELEGISLTEDELAETIRIQERAVGQPNGLERSAMVALLGEERAADFDRARDGEFQTLLRMSDRLGASADQARALWELEQEARRLADAVQHDFERPESARLADLSGLRQHLEASAETILGNRRGRDMWEHTRKSWLDQAFRIAEDDPIGSVPP